MRNMTEDEDFEEELRQVRALKAPVWELSEDSTRVLYQDEAVPNIVAGSLQKGRVCRIRDRARKQKKYFNTDPKESIFLYIAPRKPEYYNPCFYETLRAMTALCDLLGLLHLVETPADHTFRPPSYRKHEPYRPPPVSIIEHE